MINDLVIEARTAAVGSIQVVNRKALFFCYGWHLCFNVLLQRLLDNECLILELVRKSTIYRLPRIINAAKKTDGRFKELAEKSQQDGVLEAMLLKIGIAIIARPIGDELMWRRFVAMTD